MNLLKLPNEAYIPYQTDRFSVKFDLPTFPAGNITMRTIIEAALAMVLSNEEKSEKITFRSTGTGRSLPIPGIQSMVGILMTFFPIHIVVPLNSNTDLKTFLESVQKQQVATTQHEYLGVEAIGKLTPNGNDVCNWDSPYLIIQDGNNKFEFLGLEEIEQPGQPSRTPLSICCVLKPSGIKMNVGYDNNTINGVLVKSLVNDFGGILGKILARLADRGDVLVRDLMKGM